MGTGAISPHVFDVEFPIRPDKAFIIRGGKDDIGKVTVRLEIPDGRYINDRELEKLAVPFAENKSPSGVVSPAIVKRVLPATLIRPPGARAIHGEEDCFVWWVLRGSVARSLSPLGL